MALIKCPECGQAVLSVASQCPSCSRRLEPEPGKLAEPGELTQCRKCGELLTRRSRRCPHCNHVQSARRWVVAGAATLTLVLVIAIVFIVGMSEPAVLPASAGSPPVMSIVQPVPERTFDSAAIAMPVTPPADTAARVVSTLPTVKRWTTNWANVRLGRTRESAVVVILQPGQEIDVGDRRGGWWTVYEADSVVGFVAGNLLATAPPADEGSR